MVQWLFWSFWDKLQTLPSISPESQAAQGRNHHDWLTLSFRIKAFATNVRGLLGHSLHDISPTGLMSCGFTSCVMPMPQRGFHNLGNYNDMNAVDMIRHLNTQQPPITEPRAVYFCKNVLLNNSPCSIAHQLSNTNDISIIYIWVPKTIQRFFKLFCNPKKTSPEFQLADP